MILLACVLSPHTHPSTRLHPLSPITRHNFWNPALGLCCHTTSLASSSGEIVAGFIMSLCAGSFLLQGRPAGWVIADATFALKTCRSPSSGRTRHLCIVSGSDEGWLLSGTLAVLLGACTYSTILVVIERTSMRRALVRQRSKCTADTEPRRWRWTRTRSLTAVASRHHCSTLGYDSHPLSYHCCSTSCSGTYLHVCCF